MLQYIIYSRENLINLNRTYKIEIENLMNSKLFITNLIAVSKRNVVRESITSLFILIKKLSANKFDLLIKEV